MAGIATVGQGLVTNVSGLVGCRFVIGIFEAGVFPGESRSNPFPFVCAVEERPTNSTHVSTQVLPI